VDKEITFEDLVEIKLHDPEDFLKIKETLTRIGVKSRKDKTLFQSCHILHKQGRYAIVHFKELFGLDGKETTIDTNDIARRNTIANLLEEWGLLEIVNSDKTSDPVAPISQIKIVRYADKDSWNLEPKFNIGRKKSEHLDATDA
jgi:hypothetical protein